MKLLKHLLLATLLLLPGCATAQIGVTGAENSKPVASAPPSDPIALMKTNMACTDCWLEVTGTGAGSYLASLTDSSAANCLANFDFNNGGSPATWASPTDCAATAIAGIGGHTVAEAISFGAAAIRDTDGLTCNFGGGHGDSGNGTVTCFSLVDAADYYNHNGLTAGGTWTERVNSARYTDCHTTSKPSWSNQTCTDTGAANASYWQNDNIDGIHMPIAVHGYLGSFFGTGSDIDLFFLGGRCAYAQPCAAGGAMGGGWIVNTSNNAVTANLVTASPLTQGAVTVLDNTCGWTACLIVLGDAPAVHQDSVSGNVFAMGNGNFISGGIFKWTNPTNSSLAPEWVSYSASISPCFSCDFVIIPSPLTGGKELLFQIYPDADINSFLYYDDINQTFVAQTYSKQAYASVATSTCLGSPGTYDSLRGVIISYSRTAAPTLCKITPNATISAWTVDLYSGASPTCLNTCPFDPGTGDYPRLQYLATYDLTVLVEQARMFVYIAP